RDRAGRRQARQPRLRRQGPTRGGRGPARADRRPRGRADGAVTAGAGSPVPGRAGWSAAEAERYLLGLELFGMSFGLSRMRRLMSVLDAPQERFASIHVVGTNGKSSTTRMIAALLD